MAVGPQAKVCLKGWRTCLHISVICNADSEKGKKKTLNKLYIKKDILVYQNEHYMEPSLVSDAS